MKRFGERLAERFKAMRNVVVSNTIKARAAF